MPTVSLLKTEALANAIAATQDAVDIANLAAAGANSASTEALAAIGIDSIYISETTNDPVGVIPPNGTKGAKRDTLGNWQRLEVIGGAWTPVGAPLLSKGNAKPNLSNSVFVSKTNPLADFDDLPAAVASLPVEGGTIILDNIILGSPGYTGGTFTQNNLTIIGGNRPILDFENDTVVNDCSVVEGRLEFRGNNITLERICVLTNTAELEQNNFQFPGAGGTYGLSMVSCAAIGHTTNNIYHGLVIENIEYATVVDFQCIKNSWGIAWKASHGRLFGLRGKDHANGVLIVKADGDHTVEDVIASNIQYKGITSALMVQNLEETSQLHNIQISDFYLDGGFIFVRANESVDEVNMSNIEFTNGIIDQTTVSFTQNIWLFNNNFACDANITFTNIKGYGAGTNGVTDAGQKFTKLSFVNCFFDKPNTAFNNTIYPNIVEVENLGLLNREYGRVVASAGTSEPTNKLSDSIRTNSNLLDELDFNKAVVRWVMGRNKTSIMYGLNDDANSDLVYSGGAKLHVRNKDGVYTELAENVQAVQYDKNLNAEGAPIYDSVENLFRSSEPATDPLAGERVGITFAANDWVGDPFNGGLDGKVIFGDNTIVRNYYNTAPLTTGQHWIMCVVKPDDGQPFNVIGNSSGLFAFIMDSQVASSIVVEDMGNGFYLASGTVTVVGGGTNNGILKNTGYNAIGFETSAIMIVKQTFRPSLTQYIKTVGTILSSTTQSVTKATPTKVRTASKLGIFIGVKIPVNISTSTQTIFEIGDGTATNFINIAKNSNDQISLSVIRNGSGQSTPTTIPVSFNTHINIAVVAEENNFSFHVNGATIASYPTVRLPLALNEMFIGQSRTGTAKLHGLFSYLFIYTDENVPSIEKINKITGR